MRAISRLLPGAVALLLVSGCATAVTGTPQAAPAPTGVVKPSSTARPGTPAGADKSSEAAVALMRKIQATDVCALHDEEFLKSFGPKVLRNSGPGFFGCTGIGGTPNAEHFWLFELKVGLPYEPREKTKDKAEDVGGRKVYFPTVSGTEEDTCHAKIPIGQSDYAAVLRARMVPNTGKQAPWPERCQKAGQYLALLAPKLENPPPRSAPGDSKLLGKDPCERKDQILGLYPDYQVTGVEYVSPYDCRISLGKATDPAKLLFSLSWDLDEEPNDKSSGLLRKERVTFGGLPAIRLTSGDDRGRGGRCQNTVVVKPAEKDVKFSAHLIKIEADQSVDFSKQNSEKPVPVPPADCGPVNQVTEAVVAGL